ncbi:InlB B-repeat-containing protein [Glaciibacter psychrotolerans]|uniref:Uncharacterized protein n=1 Tax=Glaciibacter psychrotolerans TaxID=670054 RepID=A0A7Z0EF34_9MICO|nr:InlB B-repeat-containing protein [Leifsonia psychrotolerans]NYJ20338.1 hypothetical protein [Leifsonia psychrotolerans]
MSGHGSPTAQDVVVGQKAARPGEPTAPGAVFNGWAR